MSFASGHSWTLMVIISQMGKQVAYHLNLCIYNIATDFQYICILLSHMTIKATCHVQKE